MNAATSASSTFRDTGIVLATTVLGLVGSLGTQSCLAWFLEPTGRGAFAVCVTFASVLAVVVGPATDRGVQYHMIARDLSVARATMTAYVTVLASAAAACAIGWSLTGVSHSFFSKADSGSFRLSLALIPLLGLTTVLSLLLSGLGRFAVMGALSTFSIAANLVFTVLLVGLFGLGVDGALWALILGYAATVILQSGALWKSVDVLEWPRRADFSRVLSYGLRFYVARLGNVVNVQIGMIVMAWVAAPAEIGLFAAASALVGRVMVIPDSISTALQPRVGADVNGRPDLVATGARASFATVGAGLVALLAVSSFVVPILLSEAFASAVSLLWLMAPGLWIKSAATPLRCYFMGMNRPGVVSLSTGVEVAANFAGMPLLYQRAGIDGAAAATSLACVLGSLVLVVAFHASTGMGLGKVWLLRRTDLARLEGFGRLLRLRLLLAPAAVAASSPEDAIRSHLTHLWPDRVVKYLTPALVAVEAEKTARAAEIGAATRMFRAPRVLAANPARGRLDTERLHGLVQLHEVLLRGADAERLVAAAGRALAAIHRQLVLPEAMRVPLSSAWATPDAGVDVALHGDFNTYNLFASTETGELVILDWETMFLAHSPTCNTPDSIPTMGPRYFDLASFVASLFRRSWFGISRIPDAPGLAEIFLRSYFSDVGLKVPPAGLSRYLLDFAFQLRSEERKREPSGFTRLLFHPRSETIAYGVLRAFAESLAARPLERFDGPIE